MFKFFQKPGAFFKRNGSTLLTFIGAGGVILTSIMSATATPKALTMVDCAKKEKGSELTPLETVKAAGPAYIPAAVIGASTIACIFGANVLNQRSQASLMSAYALLDSSYKKYREKVGEVYGLESADRVNETVVRDDYANGLIQPRKEQRLFYDTTAMRYFESTMEDLELAEDQLNQNLMCKAYVSLNDFYRLLGVPEIDGGDRLGWTTYDRGYQKGCDGILFHHTKVDLDDGLECCILQIVTEPSMDYLDY